MRSHKRKSLLKMEEICKSSTRNS